MARDVKTGEMKYFVSNALASVTLKTLMMAAFVRWHVEKWFERGQQEAGFWGVRGGDWGKGRASCIMPDRSERYGAGAVDIGYVRFHHLR